MVKGLVTVLIIMILGISIAPFIELGTKIQWTTYFGIPLVILIGSVGVAFISRRFEAIIGGVVISALWPVLLGTVKSILSSL